MKPIFNRIFNSLLWRFHTVLIILISTGLAFAAEQYNELDLGFPITGIPLVITVFGLLAITWNSHDALNKDLVSGTLRFTVTRTSRTAIFISTAASHFLYWLVLLIIIVLFTGTVFEDVTLGSMTTHITFVFFSLSAAFFLSSIIRTPERSKTAAVIIGVLFPVLTIWSYLADNWFHAVTPYHMYVYDSLLAIVIPLFLGSVLFSLAFKSMQRRDL